MSITKCPGHMRSFSDCLNFGLESENFRKFKTLLSESFLGELRTRAPFDRCVHVSRIHGSLLLSIPRGFSAVVVLYSYITEYVSVLQCGAKTS